MAVARYVSGSGTDRLRFEYVVQARRLRRNGIGLSLERDSESPFRLDGATIVDAVAGGDADLRSGRRSPAGAETTRVEARPPAATGVSMASSPASGDTYGTGETVTVRLAMRADVTVVLPGRPHVWLEVGGAVRRAEYSGPVGSATRALEFSYTVQEGDLDTDGVRLCSSDRPGIDCGRIHLNGGTIRASRGGLDAELGTPNQSAQAGHKVDATETIVTEPLPTACSAEIGVRPDWALVPSGVGHGGKFRLLFITSSDTRRGRQGDDRAVQRVRAGAGECRAQRHPAVQIGRPRAREHRGGQRPDEHLHHRCGQRHRDLLAERQQGRRLLQRPLRRQLGQRDQRERTSTGTRRSGTASGPERTITGQPASPLGSALVTYGDPNDGPAVQRGT